LHGKKPSGAIDIKLERSTGMVQGEKTNERPVLRGASDLGPRDRAGRGSEKGGRLHAKKKQPPSRIFLEEAKKRRSGGWTAEERGKYCQPKGPQD